MTMFVGDFDGLSDLKEQYRITDEDLQGVEILYAGYQGGCWDGRALVLFKKNNTFYVVDSSHCSCFDLEDQWSPIETNEAALKMEIDAKSNYRYEEFKSFITFCRHHFKWEYTS